MTTNFFKKTTLQKLQKMRKIFLKTAVWLLIAGFVFSAIVILTDGWNMQTTQIHETILTIVIILFANVVNLLRIEKDSAVAQWFAIISFFSSLVSGVLTILLIWYIIPYFNAHHITVMLVATYTAIASFCVSNIAVIKEVVKSVKPLKITAMICMAYLWFFGVFVAIVSPAYDDIYKLYQLSGLATAAFIIATLSAWVISRTHKR